MRYPGGKSNCYQRLINLIPPHRIYIETHLGGGAVLRRKKAAEESIGVDIDPRVIARFRRFAQANVQLLVESAEDFLSRYQFCGDEFVYLDPPYIRSTCRAARSPYRFTYTERDHATLLHIVRSLPCKVMISGYAHPLYDHMLSDWYCTHFSVPSRVGRRIEFVWLNYEPHLLHDTRFLGDTFRERQTIQRRRQRWLAKFAREPLAIQQALLSDMQNIFSGRNSVTSSS